MNCDHPHVLSNGIDVILFVKRMCEKKKLNIYNLVLNAGSSHDFLDFLCGALACFYSIDVIKTFAGILCQNGYGRGLKISNFCAVWTGL